MGAKTYWITWEWMPSVYNVTCVVCNAVYCVVPVLYNILEMFCGTYTQTRVMWVHTTKCETWKVLQHTWTYHKALITSPCGQLFRVWPLRLVCFMVAHISASLWWVVLMKMKMLDAISRMYIILHGHIRLCVSFNNSTPLLYRGKHGRKGCRTFPLHVLLLCVLWGGMTHTVVISPSTLTK